MVQICLGYYETIRCRSFKKKFYIFLNESLSFFRVWRKYWGNGAVMINSLPSRPMFGIWILLACKCIGIVLVFVGGMLRFLSRSPGSFCGAYLSWCEYLWSPKMGHWIASLKWTRIWWRTPVSGSNWTNALDPLNRMTCKKYKLWQHVHY